MMNNNLKLKLFITLIISIIFASIELYISIEYENDVCQVGDRIGLTLSKWLFVRAIISYTVSVLLLLFIFCSSIFCIILMALATIICYIMNIIGVVILSTPENSQCVYNKMGVYSIVIITIYALTPAFILSIQSISYIFNDKDEEPSSINNVMDITKV